ncbi:MAG: hypothetical protein DCC52_16270 [Chloroflexi bacterium]|nr:MAG: hypothetical protein DCC52_16270 [Chloroflexota bacterium]
MTPLPGESEEGLAFGCLVGAEGRLKSAVIRAMNLPIAHPFLQDNATNHSHTSQCRRDSAAPKNQDSCPPTRGQRQQDSIFKL